ncbi:hypothetical protein P5673_030386 [Acropora cervicornis]|uniref:Uncharacterized protein n=1 Tax=Acropora cervicornis TaxID=6130 RepID=A0AAD9PUL9_ACRCE|nr:hypothetical protein P5673_030386 [Acropora cervicornis]
MHEEALLSEETDVLSGRTSSTQGPLFALLQTLNKNMGESLRSLKQNEEAQTPTTVESAKNRKSPSTGDDSDTEVSDADKLLASNYRPKVVTGQTCADYESDPLLDEIAKSLTDSENTSPKVSDKLGKIVNLRWLNKLD